MKPFTLLLLIGLPTLRLFAQEPKLMLPIGHSLGVATAVYSPDGKRIVTSSLDNSVKIWEINSRMLLANLRGHTDTVLTATYSPNGKLIVTAAEDGQVKIWDAITATELLDLKGHVNKVYMAEFSQDGKKVVTASEDKTAKIWDAESGKLLFDLKEYSSAVWWVRLSQDGKKVVAASQDKTAKIWDAETGKLLFNLKGHTSGVREADFDPAGSKIVSCSEDSTAKIWDAETGKLLFDLKGHKGVVSFARFNPDGKKILTGSDDGTAKVWNLETGELLFSLTGKKKDTGEYRGYWPDIVTGAHFSPDGKKILTSYVDSCVKIWDATTGKLLKEIKRNYEFTNSASFSPDSKKIALALAFAHVEIWDIASGNLIVDLKGSATDINSVSISSDGKRLVMASQSGSAKLFDATTGALIAVLGDATKNNRTLYAQFSPDGKKILGTSLENFANIYDAVTGQLLYELKGHVKQVLANYSPDGKRIFSFSTDGMAKVWEAASGKLIFTIQGNKAGTNGEFFISYSSDGKKLLAISRLDGLASIWDAETGKLTTEVHHQFLRGGQLSPNGKKLLTTSQDSTAKIWNAENGELILVLKEPGRRLQTAMFSPDGSRIFLRLSERIKGTVITKMWNAETGAYMAELNQEGSNPDFFASIFFTIDGKRMFSGMSDGSIKFWDARTGELVKNFKGLKQKSNARLNSFTSPVGSQFVLTTDEGHIRFFDSETGNLIRELNGHTFTIHSVRFFDGDKKIITVSSDYTAKIWDAETNNLLLTYLAVGENDYLILDKDNHFDGSENGRKQLYFTCGTEVIELDQVKDQLWVPNLAERVMNGETINAAKLSDLNICNLTPIVDTIDQSALQYKFRITPRLGGLGITTVYVNGIEVKKYTSQQLVKQNEGYLLAIDKKEIQKFFVAGKENSISVKSLTTKNSISSRSISINEKGNEKSIVAPNLYAVVVGVSDYKGDGLDLKFAAKDAIDMAAALDISAKKLLNTDGKEHVFIYKVHTALGRDKFPEKNSIKQLFAEIGSKAQPNDILLIFFAGHGVVESEKNQFYFLTADASNVTVSGALKNVGISTEELAEWIQPQMMKAQKRILIFDACNSGQALKEIISFNNDAKNLLASRGDENGKQKKAIEKLNEKSGMFILSASASDQKAYEIGKYNQGALTYSLLKAIKERPDILEDRQYLNISRWFGAAEKTVGELARETGTRQQPQVVSTSNFNIGIVDEEVRNKIVLPFEKYLFTRSDFRNTELRVDNLKLRNLVDKALSDLSDDNTGTPLLFNPEYEGSNVYSLSCDYSIVNDEIIASVIIIKGGQEIKNKFELKDKTGNINQLSAVIVATTKDWIEKNK